MIQPIRHTILIKPCKSDDISAGGIYVPETCQERSSKAIIVATGNGTKDKPMRYKTGQTVFNIKDCGDEIIIDGERHYLIQQDWVIAQLN